jgi:hypothetical protein
VDRKAGRQALGDDQKVWGRGALPKMISKKKIINTKTKKYRKVIWLPNIAFYLIFDTIIKNAAFSKCLPNKGGQQHSFCPQFLRP